MPHSSDHCAHRFDTHWWHMSERFVISSLPAICRFTPGSPVSSLCKTEKEKRKEIPRNTWEVVQRSISQTPNLVLAAGEPGFSGGKGHSHL